MDAIECIRTRMSIRKFRPDPVPADLILKIIDTAKWSPSYKNTQPWEIVLISGAKKEALSNMLIGLLEKGAAPTPDLPEPLSWPDMIKARIDVLMKKRSEAIGQDLNDPEVRIKSKRANFRFYGAPHGLLLFQDASLTAWSIFDLGLFTQSLMLAAHSYGLGTVPQAFLTDYAGEVKKFLGIPDTKRMVLGISIGYPDLESPVNRFRTDRVETTEIVRVVS